MQTITVFGSYGKLIVNADTGEVTDYIPEYGSTPDYVNIARVDLAEYRQWLATQGESALPELIDICAIGFWSTDGSYEPAIDDFRNNAWDGPVITLPTALPF